MQGKAHAFYAAAVEINTTNYSTKAAVRAAFVCYTGTMNPLPKDQALWNIVFSVLFLVLTVGFFWILTEGFYDFGWLFFITFFDVAIISLATFRLIRLVTFDKIFAFARNLFLVRQEDGTYRKEGGGPRRTIAELMECLWCTGLWAALFSFVLYFVDPIGRFFVFILALAALGSFLQNFSQMIARISSK